MAILHGIMTIMPCERLLYLYYREEKANDFDAALLNFSWLRRLISLARILIQIYAVEGLLNGGFVSSVCLTWCFYIFILILAIFPQGTTSNDTMTWYRKV